MTQVFPFTDETLPPLAELCNLFFSTKGQSIIHLKSPADPETFEKVRAAGFQTIAVTNPSPNIDIWNIARRYFFRRVHVTDSPETISVVVPSRTFDYYPQLSTTRFIGEVNCWEKPYRDMILTTENGDASVVDVDILDESGSQSRQDLSHAGRGKVSIVARNELELRLCGRAALSTRDGRPIGWVRIDSFR